jgi:hypothetical protein
MIQLASTREMEEKDLVIRTSTAQLFKIDTMIIRDCNFISVKPEFRFLFGNIWQLGLRRDSPTHPRQLARQVRLYR